MSSVTSRNPESGGHSQRSGLPQEEIDELGSPQRTLNEENREYEGSAAPECGRGQAAGNRIAAYPAGIETTRIDQLGQVGALSDVEVAERQRERRRGCGLVGV